MLFVLVVFTEREERIAVFAISSEYAALLSRSTPWWDTKSDRGFGEREARVDGIAVTNGNRQPATSGGLTEYPFHSSS